MMIVQKLMHTSPSPSPTGDWGSKSARRGGETVIKLCVAHFVLGRCGVKYGYGGEYKTEC